MGRRNGRQRIWAQAARTAMSSRRGPRAATQRLHPTGASVVSYAGAQKGPKGRFCAGACRLTLPRNRPKFSFRSQTW